jgi:hypothetical protein
MINEELVIKGAVSDIIEKHKKEDKDITCTRVFIDNLKAIYSGTESKQRKQLANLFKILPYINYKYNVFCENPTEQDELKIKPLTWTELARKCGYEEKKHVTTFKKNLMSLKVNGEYTIGEFTVGSEKKIIVNPSVYYGGDNIIELEGVKAYFRISKNNK